VKKLFTVGKYLKYHLKAGTVHDVHSPFVYDLLNNVIKDKTPFYGFDLVESLRSKHQLDRKIINITDLGTGRKDRKERICDIVNTAVKAKKYSQLLFRLANRFQSENILEFGTSLGLTTLYLSLPRKESKVITIEGSPEISEIAKENFRRLKRNNIELITGEFDKVLPEALQKLPRLDLVYFDGNHRKEPTLSYFEKCLNLATEDSIFIFDDIHWSREMNEAWNIIKENPSVTLTIDLFQLGLVFFRKGIPKQHFTLRF
jgi:predicted O-methyltransferase YrrM